jgi:hypothetical protein
MIPLLLVCSLASLQAQEPPKQPAAAQDPRPMASLFAEFYSAPRDKDGRITFTMPVASSFDRGGGLTLRPPRPKLTGEDFKKNPAVLDTVEVTMLVNVVTRLKKLGITDLDAHFKGRTVRVTGKATSVMYTGYPAQLVCAVTVDKIDDLEVLPKDKQ